jgi:hypothetical protein
MIYMLLDNDFYILVKKTYQSHTHSKYEKFSSLLPLLYYSQYLLFFTMMPQWTSDDGVLLSEFSTERALEK